MQRKVISRTVLGTLAALTLAAALSACTRLTLENYSQIKVGMEEEAVFALIGRPDRCDDVMSIRNCTWTEGERFVRVSFAGAKVLLFASQNLN